VRIALLGSFEARDDAGQSVEIPGKRLRALLTRLALDQGHLVTAETLVDAVWGDEPPAGAGNALHSLVSRLRRALPPDDGTTVESLPAGYRLSAAAEATDVAQFERLAAEGRACRDAGDAGAAASLFAGALGLWRGAPLDGLGEAPFAGPVIAHLTELRLRTAEGHAELALASGQTADLAADLHQLTLEHPLDERLRGLHMRALAAAGRPAEALAAFEDLRRCLAETLGIDPSPSLRDLHTAILRGAAAPGAPGSSQPAGGRSEPGASHRPAPRRTHFATAATSFLGRGQDLARVAALLADARLVTLVGPGGVGKTRLAAELAAGWQAADVAWLAELAGIRDPAGVPAAVCAALGLQPGPDLAGQLRDRELLIVLDNCEHLVGACAVLAEAVLGGCPGVRILATSREPLTAAGERVYPVQPLPVPPPAIAMGDAPGVPALRLFADRAAAAVYGFRLTPENLPAVAEICRRLDGLPLAIELACARLRTLPAADLAVRLDDRFQLLTGGSRAALPRHQTLQAVVEWSWDLLTGPERTLARRLAVFAGGATVAAAEAVCADGQLPTGEVVVLLGALADKSFVELREAPGAPPRYRMLDTIRAYAQAALDRAGESGRFLRAHARYFLAMAEAAEPLLRTSAQPGHLAWLRREHDNLGAALRYAAGAGDADTAVRLVAALGWYWTLRGNHGEAAAWLREVLAMPGADAAPRQALATAYACDAMHHFAIQDFGRGQRSAARAAELAPAAAQPATGPGATPAAPGPAGTAGPHSTAPHPAIALVRALLDRLAAGSADFAGLVANPDPWLSATGHLYRGFAAELRGDAPAAASHFAAARDAFTAVGDGWGVAGALRHLGSGYGLGGDHSAAVAALDQAIAFADAVGAEDDAAWLRAERGMALLRAGDIAAARAGLASAMTSGHALHSAMVTAFAEAALGEVSRQAGEPAQARALLTAARRRLDEAGGVPPRVRLLPLSGLARLAAAEGQLAEARRLLAEALGLVLPAGPPLLQDRPAIAGLAEALADLALAGGHPADAARLLGYAAAARGAPDQGNPDVRRVAAAAQAALDGEDEGQRVQAEGMSADAAVTELTALARQLTG
jgi:predicted ATPase/DNA-binding SARP family transcriptional activator